MAGARRATGGLGGRRYDSIVLAGRGLPAPALGTTARLVERLAAEGFYGQLDAAP
jgi:hypothetical protein